MFPNSQTEDGKDDRFTDEVNSFYNTLWGGHVGTVEPVVAYRVPDADWPNYTQSACTDSSPSVQVPSDATSVSSGTHWTFPSDTATPHLDALKSYELAATIQSSSTITNDQSTSDWMVSGDIRLVDASTPFIDTETVSSSDASSSPSSPASFTLETVAPPHYYHPLNRLHHMRLNQSSLEA